MSRFKLRSAHKDAVSAQICGVEHHADGWHPFVEQHHPCVGGKYGDHKRCTVMSTWLGPACVDQEAAVEALHKSEIVMSDGSVLKPGDFDRVNQS